MRIIKFISEFQKQLAVGWSFKSATRNAWKRSHPKAEQKQKDWIERICE